MHNHTEDKLGFGLIERSGKGVKFKISNKRAEFCYEIPWNSHAVDVFSYSLISLLTHSFHGAGHSLKI